MQQGKPLVFDASIHAGEAEPADGRNGTDARSEPSEQVGLAEIRSAEESDLGVEVFADHNVIERRTPHLSPITHSGPITLVLADESIGSGLRVVAEKLKIFQKEKVRVGAIGLIGPPPSQAGVRAILEQDPYAAAGEYVPTDPQDAEGSRLGIDGWLVTGADADRSHLERADLSGNSTAPENG